MWSSVFNVTTLGAVALSVYMWFTYTKLYEMMNPLHGVELVPGEPTVAPHWAENTTFSVLCFLSSARRFTPFKVSTLKENQALLFINHGLRYNDLQGEITMHFNITTAGNAAEAAAMSAAAAPAATSGSALAGLSGLLWPAAAPANVTTASVSKAIWKLLRTNTSSVHLHILAVKTSGARAPPKAAKPSKRRGRDGAGGQAENGADAEVDAEAAAPVDPDVAALGGLDEITAALLAEGSALYDVVGMVKFDRVPKVSAARGRGASCGDETRRSRLLYTTSPCLLAPQSYAHRYLLRDVAWLVSVMHGLTRICCVAASSVVSLTMTCPFPRCRRLPSVTMCRWTPWTSSARPYPPALSSRTGSPRSPCAS
jgi:hypothetical protein